VLLRFFSTHVDSLGEIKSLAVVREMVGWKVGSRKQAM
jgi:hypothetical protein